ncbi:MAG: glutathione peroxidase [Chitinophaga sp.]|nr:glutathione peroxidase [Chitinophaga sp.]
MTLRQSILKTFYPVIMFLGKLFPSAHAVLENKQQINPTVSFYSLQATTNNGDIISFEAFKGKKVLIINTASDCGFTAQYDELEKLHELYKDSLIMLAFPANDFKQQEKGTDAEIAAFCKKNYGISFNLMQKCTVVKNENQHPVFSWLSSSDKNGWCNQAPTWNFNKYLINENGVLLNYFDKTVSPLSKKVLAVVK